MSNPVISQLNVADAVAFSLTQRKLGDKAEGDKKEVTTSADKEMIKIIKTLFDCPEFDAIVSFDAAVRKWIYGQTVTLLGRRNLYLTRKEGVKYIDQKMREYAGKRKELVDKFIQIYPIIIEKAKGQLNGQYDLGDYLSAERAARKFGMDWYYLQLGVPDNLPEDIRQEQQDKLAKQLNDAGEAIRDGLRVGFVKLVEHLLERLKPDADGKPQRFHESNIQNILDFIDALERRNLTNDAELVAVANQAKALIEGAEAKTIRQSTKVRTSMIENMGKVQQACDKLISPERRRMFDLED